MLLRKLSSLATHLRRGSDWGPVIRRNMAQLRGRLNGSGHFVYRSAVDTPFVCFPENPISLRLFVKGYQETTEMRVATAWLRPGDRCIDVGANVGLLTAVFAASVGDTGGVLALEPSPSTFSYLVSALRILQLPQVTPLACCAADQSGLASFYLSAGADVDAEEESMQIDAERSAEFRRTLAPMIRLDAVETFTRARLLKIDVEGAEPLVLAGGSELLEGEDPPLVICEIHRKALANFDFEPEAVLAYFPHDRFDLYFIPRSVSDATSARRHGEVYPLESPQQLPIYSNLLALPRLGDPGRRAAVLDHVCTKSIHPDSVLQR